MLFNNLNNLFNTTQSFAKKHPYAFWFVCNDTIKSRIGFRAQQYTDNDVSSEIFEISLYDFQKQKDSLPERIQRIINRYIKSMIEFKTIEGQYIDAFTEEENLLEEE